ncbi:(Fe-S)-binding protein [Pseudomaricurvus sp. HS19]|uniref:(Fe-S)-binding protein n=1 Tax=Pseudomaricurvus sp. HS19 TaxID=2692626 RepID=UPI0013701CA7|nr:(Fe-S)-binding protein [Pseudomaricurvus sp. HS19]MYM63351.1 (Fe-S)-binding protein [Pseudomaricurvus sp. HS19]
MAVRQRVGLFASCPVDLMRPSVGFASATLLQRAGFAVEVPPQSCCGQVNFNSGMPEQTRQLAWQLITTFEAYDYTVVPAGSCGGMIRHHYPELFKGDPRLPRVREFCERVYELTTFLAEVANVSLEDITSASALTDVVTYHDSCAGLREMGIKAQPRELLQSSGVTVTEMAETDVCCGFGGAFCVKFSDVSGRMADNKLDNACAAGANLVVGGDVSCLLHLAGRAQRRGLPLQFRHVAEVLAGDFGTPAIGEAEGGSHES